MSCDAELQELMVQVDRMVEDKKSEWQDKLKMAESKLNHFYNENDSLKSLIENKNSEIETLKARLKLRENLSNESEYDHEVLQLKMELSQIQKRYDKYHHKYTKKLKDLESEKEEAINEKMNAIKQLNELKNEHNNCGYHANQLMEQIDELNNVRITIQSEKEVLAEQLKSLRSDYEYKASSFSDLEHKHMTQLQRLENQLQDANKNYQKEIEEHRLKLCEMMQQTKRCLEEKQKIMIDNESAKRIIIRLENELGRVNSELKVKEKSIFKLEQNCKLDEKTINEKNEFIKILQSNSVNKDNSSAYISKLESELHEARLSLKSTKRNEKTLQNDLTTLHKRMKEIDETKSRDDEYFKEGEKMRSSYVKIEQTNQQLISQINKLEYSVRSKSDELLSILAERDKWKQEYEKVVKQVSSESNSDAKSNVHDKNSYCKQSTINTEQTNSNLPHLQNEMNVLLKFCEEKDFVIQRLQMENRILQDFITKINSTMTEEGVYLTPNDTDDISLSGEDANFHTMREATLVDNTYFDQPDESNNKDRGTKNPLLAQYSQISADSLGNNLRRSSEEFLSSISRSCKTEKNNTLKEKQSIMDLYPTLAAARYFGDEREKTRQLEQMIDYHMSQLRHDAANAEYRRNIHNNSTQITHPNYNINSNNIHH